MKKYQFAAMATTSLLVSNSAFAGGSGFQDISDNIMKSVSDIPKLLSVMSYLVGLGLAIAGVLKLKAHVDNPQTPLKEGVIRLGAGGALFALPAVIEAVSSSIGTGTSIGNENITKFDSAF